MRKVSEDVIGKECLRQWGWDSQINIAIEECAELIVQLVKRGRNVNGSDYKSICNEIADVEIMMKQLRLIYSPELIDTIKDNKLKRLEERLGI